MKNKKIKLTFLGAVLCFGLIGCSNDDSVDGTNNNNDDSGVITNGEITLTYGSSLLNHNVQNLNERLNIQGMNGASARSANSIPSYTEITNFDGIAVLPNHNPNNSNDSNVTITAGQSYKIPAGTENTASQIVIEDEGVLYLAGTISGSKIEVRSGAKLVIVGNYSQDKIEFNQGGTVIIAPNVNYTTNKTIKGIFKNWGIVFNSNSTFEGSLINNNVLTFTSSNQINLNSSSSVTNNCKMIFEGKMHLDNNLTNNSFLKLEKGFMINSSGNLIINTGSYTKLAPGYTYKYDGSIKNLGTGFARLDLLGTIDGGNLNTSASMTGKIDVNLTSYSLLQLKTDADVSLNGNIYVQGSNCTETAGTAPSNGATCSITALDETAKYVGHVVSPIVEGITLSATDVKVVNNKAYVSYHTNDEAFGGFPYGSIRVFDINDGQVSLASEANFNNCEFNALAVENNKVYGVGNNLDGGRMFSTPLGADKNITTNLAAVWSTKTPSLGGKSIAFNNNTLWLVGGATGGLYKNELVGDNYNLNSTTSPFVTQNGGKYVTFNNSKQVFFALKNGNPYLRIAGADGTLIAEKTDTTITLTNTDGKNAISVDDNYIYVALSEQGVAKYSLVDGSLVSRFVPSTVRNASGSRVFPNNGLSNAVTSDDCFVYVANGADGVIILDKTTFKHVGHFKTGLNHSTNFVYAKDNYLFVANGRDGLRVIKLR